MDLPSPGKLPDPAKWKGGQPTPMQGVAVKCSSKAARAVEDAADDPFDAASRLDEVCARVAYEVGVHEPDLVFFDASTGTFWRYPAA